LYAPFAVVARLQRHGKNLNKDAALAAGYALSVAENTKQRIWKPQVLAEYERVRRTLTTTATPMEV